MCRSNFEQEWELLCVDNGSTESIQPLTDEFGTRSIAIRLQRNRENLSFSQANNRAALAARGRHLVFLNNDVIVTENALARLIAAFELEPAAGVAGGKLLFPHTGLVQHAGMAQMLWGYASNFAVGAAADAAIVQQKRKMQGVTGAMLAIDRLLFETLGGFEEQYRWGYEDLDLCLKAQQAGRTVFYIPEAVGFHEESSTLKGRQVPSESEENYRLFRRTWDHFLVPKESAYLDRLRAQGIRRLALFGAGRAAQGLYRTLERSHFDVVACASTEPGTFPYQVPVVPPEELGRFDFDRMMVGSQYFFQVEKDIAGFDPTGAPLFPVLW